MVRFGRGEKIDMENLVWETQYRETPLLVLEQIITG